mmetsp:Transcript_40523/g.101372  ORF Transcript_40523/g.101372 Transcript_40523/m.101372 type:complete len:86 (-) Transcript_40523:35-292(-)
MALEKGHAAAPGGVVSNKGAQLLVTRALGLLRAELCPRCYSQCAQLRSSSSWRSSAKMPLAMCSSSWRSSDSPNVGGLHHLGSCS